MTAKRSVKRFLKILGITFSIMIVLLAGFHFWFKAHAKQMLEDMVESKSNGKLKLKIQKIHFNYFSRKITLDKAVFYNTDTLTGTTSYHFEVDKMQLQAKAILPIVFKKQILIDSLTLLNPHIEVTRLREGIKSGKKEKKDVSIPEEMGKVYSSIQDALKLLKVKRFQIDDGTFTLINKIDPTQLPLKVTNIDFHIDNLQVDDKQTGNNKILFSDNVGLLSSNQDILFPDGRHRLSFKNFRINLERKLVEFDSCTITATRNDSASASFKVFFDVLMLTNIDFDTLYKAEVIKADSVYCINPTFALDVEVGKKKGSKKAPPKLENIIKQLTGDLQLGYVIVTNASFNIKTVKNNVPSSFTFSNNNFEMQGLNIDQQAAKPIKVKSFAMAIRNYENFIRDSSYSIKFDSVVFKDDRITLSNFLFNKLDNGRILNTFSIPQFNLIGLSWDDLVFEKKLKAEQAIMFNPYINYTVSTKPSSGKQNIFQSLGAINEYMDIQQLDVVEGAINLKLKNNLKVQLDNATLSIQSHSLLESKKLAGIKNSLTQLRFDEGIIHAGNLDIELHNIAYVGKSGQFEAKHIDVNNKQKSTAISLQDVYVEKMQVNEITGNVYAEGVSWKKGDVNINSLAAKKGSGETNIELKNVHGSNTIVNSVFGSKAVTTILSSIYFARLEKKGESKLQLSGLDINGNQLKVNDNNFDLSIADYNITDNENSFFKNILYKANNGKTRSDISIPSLTVIPRVQSLINGDVILDGVNISNPVINLHLAAIKTSRENKTTNLPKIDINQLRLSQPLINYTQDKDSGQLILAWHGEKNNSNFLQVNDFHSEGKKSSLGQIEFYLTDFLFTSPKGKSFNTGDGKIASQIKNLKFEKQDDESTEWSATVSSLEANDFRLDSIGKAKGNLILKSGLLNNLVISSYAITNLQNLAAVNSSFQVKKLTGYYSTGTTNFTWGNAGFNRITNNFSLDSFSMIPTLSRDSFIAKQKYQTDYFSLKTGAINFGPFDIDSYIKNKTLIAKKITVDNFLFKDYKDRLLPFREGIIKPLPVNLLKNISQKISIDAVELTNANVEYTEVSEKTRMPGVIPVTRMNVKMSTVKNYNLTETDSLDILATGYLMDTAWLRLRVKESYTDSLAGFLMTLRMRPADLAILNPALIPLASIRLESGFLDTLSMRAVGREYLSWGEMQMLYHDLKIRFLKNGDEKNKSFFNGLITFLANTLVKNKNTSRTGNVFFIRKRDRSALNYLIKIATSGMASSVGIKSNKKMMRRYKKELEKLDLPPIDFE